MQSPAPAAMPSPLIVTFAAGASGGWRIARIDAVRGESLAPAARLAIVEGPFAAAAQSVWALRGAISHARYATRAEIVALDARQEGLMRPAARAAALIPIRKTAAWWRLAQDERRAIFEEQSRHVGIGLDYLPAVARRLHHSRDLGLPFDFLTWFEFAPEHESAFDEMLGRLRETEEWRYIDREIDVRLARI